MIVENGSPRKNVAAAPHNSVQGSYLDWGSIIAGSVFALALSFLLISFGASLGLSLSSPYRGEGVSAAWLAIAAGIWFAWVMVTAFGAGGYISGRLRHRAGDASADEVEIRDGGHGLMVWATGALVGIVIAASGIGGVIGLGTKAVGSAAGTVAEVASQAASSDYFANLMLRNTVDAPQDANRDGASTEADSSERQTPPRATQSTNIDPAVQQEIAGIVTRSLTNGEVDERDRAYIAQLVATNTDLSQEQARARVAEVNSEIEQAYNTAIETVESARVTGVVFGFIAVATLLLGAIAAYFAAVAGGHHRNEGLGLNAFSKRH